MPVDFPSLPSSIASPPAPFSHVTRATGTEVFHLAGQTARRADGGEPGDIAEQTRTVFAKLAALLEAVGLDFSSVARYRTYLVDRSDLPGFGAARDEVYARIHPDGRHPANTLLVVSGLAAEGLRLEIEAVAVR